MSRVASRVAVLFALGAGLWCGCSSKQPRQSEPPQPEAPAPPKPPPKPTEVIVRSVRPPGDAVTKAGVVSYGLTRRDRDQIRALPGVVEVVPVRLIPTGVRYLERAADVHVVATVAGYADARALKLSAGRFLTAADDTELENVCVLGSDVAATLFPKEDPLGKTVGMRGHNFKVVGVLDKKLATDDDVYIPLDTSRVRFGEIVTDKNKERQKVELHEVIIRVADPDKVTAVANAVREVLEKSRPANDWDVTTR